MHRVADLTNMETNANSESKLTQADDDVAVGKRLGCPPPTPEECRQRWAAWHQAMELSHEMLMVGLRHKIGPGGDLQAAYREWYERYQALKWDTKQRAT